MKQLEEIIWQPKETIWQELNRFIDSIHDEINDKEPDERDEEIKKLKQSNL